MRWCVQDDADAEAQAVAAQVLSCLAAREDLRHRVAGAVPPQLYFALEVGLCCLVDTHLDQDLLQAALMYVTYVG